MSKGITSKTRLLLGASTLLLTSTAGMAQNVTIDNAVTLVADAAQSQDQENNGSVEATLGGGVNNDTLVGNVTDSSVMVDANLNSSIALGNTGTQSLGDADSAATDTSVALGSNQLSDGTTAATAAISVSAEASGSEVTLTTGLVDGSAVTLSNATTAATATTNTASQTVVLKSTTLDATASPALETEVEATGSLTEITADVAVGSAQKTIKSSTNATNDSSAFDLTTAGNVTDSALKLISNTQDATATGSTATNAVSLSGTTGDMGAAIVSQQSSDAASAVSALTAASISMNVEAAAVANLTDSSAAVSGNRIQAKASDGVTSNLLVVDTTTLTAANGTSTTVGFAAATGVTSNSAFTVANQQVAANNTVSAVIESDVTFAIDGVTSGSSVAVEGNVTDAFGLSNKSTNSLSLSGTTVATDAGVINRQSSNAAVSSDIGTAAAPALLIAEFEGNITDSSVAVNSNVTRGSAIGNVGNNTLSASATTLSGIGTGQALADGSADGTASASGNFSLVNSQSLGNESSSITNVDAEYGIQAEYTDSITDSRLSVSSNTQFAEALGNSGTNRIVLSATDASFAGVNPTAALSNAQDGSAAQIQADSDMDISANAESTGSSVAINGNSNTALGVINNAVNSMSVSAVTLGGTDVTPLVAAPTGSAPAVSIDGTNNETTADYALNSVQSASGSVASNATSTIYNVDDTSATTGTGPAVVTTGTTNSVITLTGNMTTAEASANRIANQLSVSGTDNGATAALNNSQTSLAATTVQSTATSSVGYAQETLPAGRSADASSISVDGNSTMALARGNSASNALNYNVGATYSGNDGAFVTGSTSLNATAAVLNNQTNGAGVSATSGSVNYSLALNDGVVSTGTGATAGAAVLNSNATLANNSVAANAFGNVATNSLNMITFGAGVPSSALASNQVNTGAVSATATNVSFGMTVGTTQGSALRNGGNNTTAQAVGNSSVNSMNGGN